MNKREKLLKLIKLAQEQGIVPADAIIELGNLDTEALISKIDKIPELWDATKLSGEIPADQLPLFTPTQRGAVPPPIVRGLILGSDGWEKKQELPKTIVQSFGGGRGGGGTGPMGPQGPQGPQGIPGPVDLSHIVFPITGFTMTSPSNQWQVTIDDTGTLVITPLVVIDRWWYPDAYFSSYFSNRYFGVF